MAPPLSPEEKQLIKATVPILEQHGPELTSRFYRRMLHDNEELKSVFSLTKMETERQPRALAYSLLAYAKNIDNLAPLADFVENGVCFSFLVLAFALPACLLARYLMESVNYGFLLFVSVPQACIPRHPA